MQLGSAQYFEEETSRFRWVRGQRCRVTMEPALREEVTLGPPDLPLLPLSVSPPYDQGGLREKIFEGEHRVLVCEGEGEEYEPLADAPRAYMAFAAAQLLPQSIRETEEEAVRFVERHGLPASAEPFRKRGGTGLPLDMFFWDADELAVAVRFLHATTMAERQADYGELHDLLRDAKVTEGGGLGRDGNLLLGAKVVLTRMLTEHLASGVALSPVVDSKDAVRQIRMGQQAGRTTSPMFRITPSYTCDSLLTAMWLQVYFAATERRFVHIRCKGCRRPFEAKDARQEYCDRRCRNNNNQRIHYRRQKARGVGS